MTFHTQFTVAAARARLANRIDAIVSSLSFLDREEKLVYDLFIRNEPSWKAALYLLTQSNVSAEYGAVFVHQKPQATFRSPSSGLLVKRELADILVIISLMDATKKHRVAFLAQAKKGSASGDQNSLRRQNRPQWELYTTWPQFTHSADSKQLQHRVFDGGGHALSRARHLVFDPEVTNTAFTAVPCERYGIAGFRDVQTLGATIERCVGGAVAHRTTWTLDPANLPTNHSDWSAVVADMTAKIRSRSASAWASPPPAQCGAGHLSMWSQGSQGLAQQGTSRDVPTDGEEGGLTAVAISMVAGRENDQEARADVEEILALAGES